MSFCQFCGSQIADGGTFCGSCGKPTGSSVIATGAAGAKAAMAPKEHTLFQNDNLVVSNTRFIVGGQTYAMSGITSVKPSVFHPSRLWPILLICFGVFGIFNSIFVVAGESAGAAVLSALLMSGIVALGVLWFRSKKPIYSVLLTTASGETKAFSSKDEALVTDIISAINGAIVHRG